MPMSFNGFLALGKETVWGTRVPRTRFVRFTQAQFNHNPNWSIVPHSQSRYEHSAHPGPYEHVLSATIEGRSDALGEILRSLFWVEPVTTNPGTLAYQHVFTPPAAYTTPVIKPYTPELRYGTANTSEVGAGGFIDSATFQWDDRLLMVPFEMPSHSPLIAAPTAAPSFTDVAPFLFQNLTLTVDPDGSPTVRSIRAGSIQINNGATRTRSSGSRFLEQPEAGAFEVEIQFGSKMNNLDDLKFLFSDGTENEPSEFCEATPQHLRLKFTGCEIEAGHNHELEFDIPAAILSQTSYPLSGKDEIVQSLTLRGLYHAGTSKVVSARLKNTVPSY